MADMKYRVMNMCKYDIGVKLPNKADVVIKAGSFQLLTADDIAYVESQCRRINYFAKRMLVPYDSNNKEVPLDQIGVYTVEDEYPHKSDKEIEAMLKLPVKKIEAWLETVEDPAELHAIADVASKMDLTSAKLRALRAKMPDVDLVAN